MHEDGKLGEHGVVTKSEAEKHLNFNPLPSKETQKKIDMLITPYNKTKVVTKFMNFNDKDSAKQHTPDAPNEKWNKISKLILYQDKYSLRNTLECINVEFYERMNKQALDQRSSSVIRQKKIKFSGSTLGDKTTRKSM